MAQKNKYDALFKILLIGDSGVGKTCMMFRFTDDTFSDSFVATIGIDFKMKTVTVNDKLVRLQIWDTAGQEKFFNITRAYYRNANCVVLVYDVTRAGSFENVKRWMGNIDEHAPDNVLRILVGNKCDLDQRRVVSYADGEQLAARYGVQFFEASAKTGKNIGPLFSNLTDALIARQTMMEGDDRGPLAGTNGRYHSNILLSDGSKGESELGKIKGAIGNCCSM